MLDFIKQLALDAGEIIKKGYFSNHTKIEYKGKIDLITKTDIESEKFIKNRISKNFPEDNILSEESEATHKDSSRLWIIDPLDGTTNFTHKYPFFAVSIALEMESKIKFGVVYNPIFNEMFWAENGKGSFLNGKKIHVSKTNKISQSLLATGFPYDRWEKGDFYIREFLAFMKKCQGVRRAGAAAIDLCYVACGRLDGFYERKLKPWDIAAGSLIITEAGGKITNYENQKWHYSNATILSSNKKIHSQMYKILKFVH